VLRENRRSNVSVALAVGLVQIGPSSNYVTTLGLSTSLLPVTSASARFASLYTVVTRPEADIQAVVITCVVQSEIHSLPPVALTSMALPESLVTNRHQ